MPLFAPGSRFQRWPERLAEWMRDGSFVPLSVSALLFFLFLGSSGLWDPWETHYAEVARRMLADGDWLTLRWRNELFFSKPVLVFWLEALSFALFGLNAWAARLPHALVGVLGVWLVWRTVRRAAGQKPAVLAALVLATSPFYLEISRQAITDITFCVFLTGVLCAYFNVATTERPRAFDVWSLWVFAALAALAKAPLGLALPGVVILADLILNRRWRVVAHLRPLRGTLLFLLLATPWYAAMLAQYGQKFFNEFFLHHNLQRAFTGVHGERGTFEYFVKQLGYGLFPWVALAPLVAGWVGWHLWSGPGGPAPHSGTQPGGHREQLSSFALLWLGVFFATFTLMVTKFHHYVFPAVPAFAMLAGLTLAEENRTGWRWLAPPAVLLLAMVGNDIVSSPVPLSNLCTYAYERPLPASEYPAMLYLGLSIVLGLALLSGGRYLHSRWPLRLLLGGGLAAAALLAWSYLPALGHTMSQQDLFDTYRRLAGPGDRLYQYQMNWRGEVFYSADTIIKLGSEKAVENVLKQPGRVFIISVADSFSAVDRAARRATGMHLHVLQGSNLRYTLSSNVIEKGEPDLNPISRNLFSSEKPPEISHSVRAEFAEGVAFLGYDLEPEQPRVGGSFTLTLYWQCLRPVAKPWRVFVHVDGHGHEFYRINGDHDPLRGLFPTDRWMPGDIVRDRVVLRVPLEYRPGRFTLYLGMYSGNPRMTVLPGFPQDGANRVRAGIINIR